MERNVCTAVYEEMVLKYGQKDQIKIITPVDILRIGRVARMSKGKQEEFTVITVDGGANVIKTRVITKGLLNHSLVHPREVFRGAIMDNAHSIICVHNHPSGSLEPSSADITVTKQLKEAGDIIGIGLLDHVIISKNGIQGLRSLGYV